MGFHRIAALAGQFADELSALSMTARERNLRDDRYWFGVVAFDISTNLSFGESFHSVEAGKVHPWAVFMSGARAMGCDIAIPGSWNAYWL